MNNRLVIISNISTSLINFRGELIKKWIDLGYEVYTLAPGYNDNHKEILESWKAKTVEYNLNRSGLNPFKDLKSLINLSNKIKEIDPDYIFSYTIKPVVFSSLISKQIDLKGMYSLIPGLGYAFNDGGLKNKIVNKVAVFLYKISLSNNDKVFFQNPDDLDLFVSLNLISKDKTVLVNGSGVDTEKFYNTDPQKEKISFLIMARLLKSKGIKHYIEAARIIKKEYPDVEFNILGSPGSGPDAVSLDYVKKADQDNIINYPGRVEDVKPFIAKNSIYVLPSYYREGTPRSILEAMSMGKPIITTDNPGCRETVNEGQNGFLIPIKNHKILADKMRYFIENKNEIVRMGKKSRKIAEEKYNVHRVNQKIIQEMNLE
ncbi:glycosyltransferase family 4 protein [Halanaerobium kushneri]|uniref:Glycosyltransferase involved in cell wall bisynthesis n=1 Tax=Halanaerobium kushneri TaxID=56779 RepID=A0A1N7B5Q0_9FIRM|nr:glycosyltransferase family 4 protein [Halanaerobium kushneri]SIR46626.1 Glycosyltransferase involved in cell wall bisynthesis [Halanaerobium kushneri]